LIEGGNFRPVLITPAAGTNDFSYYQVYHLKTPKIGKVDLLIIQDKERRQQ
jgi:hypothetical protein